LLGAAIVIVITIIFVLCDLPNRREIFLHDVHEPVVIHYPAEAFKVAIELLLFMILTRLVDVTDQEQSTRIKLGRSLLSFQDAIIANATLIVSH